MFFEKNSKIARIWSQQFTDVATIILQNFAGKIFSKVRNGHDVTRVLLARFNLSKNFYVTQLITILQRCKRGTETWSYSLFPLFEA